MKAQDKFIAIASLAFLLLPLLVPSTTDQGGISCYVIYYGEDRAPDLAKFDLAILSPLVEASLPSYLLEHGSLSLAYLSLTTIGGWEPWASGVRPD